MRSDFFNRLLPTVAKPWRAKNGGARLVHFFAGQQLSWLNSPHKTGRCPFAHRIDACHFPAHNGRHAG